MPARLWSLISGPPVEFAEGCELKTAFKLTVLWRVSVAGILWCVFVYFPLILPFFVVHKTVGVLLGTAWLAGPLVSVALARSGHIRAGNWVLMAVWSASTTILVGLDGGIHSAGIGLYVPLIVFAGWLFGEGAAIGAAVLFFAISLAFALLEQYGVGLPNYFRGSPIVVWSIFLLATGQLTVSLLPIHKAFADALILARQRADTQTMLAEALHESEDRLRTIYDAVPDAILILNSEGRIEEANEAASRQLGYSREELLQIGVGEFVAPEFRARARSRFPSMEGRASYESRHLRKDGVEVPIELNTRRITFSGEPALLAVARDISERKRAERELQSSEARFRFLSENAPIGVSMSREARIIYSNPAYLRMFGFEMDELYNRPSIELFAPQSRAEVAERAARRAQGIPVPREYEAIGLRKDGSEFPVLVSVSTMQFTEGPALVVFITDLTEMKRAHEERLRLEQQFRQAQKLESIGRLAGGVAHDFNNLLTVINGYCEMALGLLTDGGGVQDCLTEIRKAGERAAGLTHQLLAFSRKQVVEPQPVDLNEAILDSYKMLGRVVGDDIEIVTDLDREAGQAMADPGQIHQILLNLVVNARDAMPSGGRITLRTSRQHLDQAVVASFPGANPGPHVVMEVSDTGVGMSEDVQQKIFDPFFTTKPKGAGTGLGLSTVYGIVQQSGGWIGVESEPGKGATFRIGLPLAARPDFQVRHEEAPEAPLEGGETVLVVEDQEDVRRLVLSVLHAYHYETLEASSGDEALKIVENYEGPIDLILTDMIMPGMTGKQTADRLRQVRHEMKVLYMSGYTDEVISRKGSLDDGVDYIAKPFAPEALVRKVRSVLGGDNAGALKLAS
jgi:PAS domain S-box-containing protein